MKWRILVLEDDPDLREMLATVLADEGYEVFTAGAGQEAVEMAARQPFDLLVTDVRMPGVDGLEALRQVRGILPELDSLVVSGYTTEAETLRALQLNVGGYLKKPFQLNDLLVRVQQLLQQRARQQKQTTQVQRLRRSLQWALEHASAQAREAGQLAYYLAQRLGLPCEPLQWAAMLGKLGRPPAWARQDDDGLGPALRVLEAPPESLESQVLLATEWLCQGDEAPNPESCPEAIGAQVRGLLTPGLRQSPEVLAAQASAQGSESQPQALLALGRTLEEQGRWQLARDAYQSVLTQATSELSQIRAQLGLARSLHAAGHDGECYEALKQAERRSRLLSPQQGSEVRWPVARLLTHIGHASAPNYLRQLEQECQDLGQALAWARARLLGPKDEQSIGAARMLMAPEHRPALQREADWMVERLWQLAGAQEASPAWCRLAGEFADLTSQWLDGAPDPAGVRILMDSLETHPNLASLSVLDHMARLSDVAARASALRSRLKEEEAPLYLQFRSLGYFECMVNGRRIEDKMFKTQKFRYVLAYLLVQRGGVSEDMLVEDFWPDSRAGGKANVYAATTRIRRALRQGEGEREIVLREGEILKLDPQLPLVHDLDQFEAGWTNLGQDLERDQSWLKIYTGPYLQGCYLDWALRLRSQYEERLLRGLNSVAGRCLEGQPHLALELCSQGLELDPLAQELHALKIRAHLALGQPEAGIRQFQSCQSLLRKELGIEPLTSLLELHQRCRLALP